MNLTFAGQGYRYLDHQVFEILARLEKDRIAGLGESENRLDLLPGSDATRQRSARAREKKTDDQEPEGNTTALRPAAT